MALQMTQLSIFVSGTSETQVEQSALRTVVDEINKLLEKSHKITVRVIGWPNDIRPGVNQDAQKEINRQVEGQYDIYIGLLGCRFGSPTPRSGSGTAEEFEIALCQFLKDTRSVRVLFYFKGSNQDLFSIDPVELKKVQEFRKRLPELGVIYKDFSDTSQFVSILKNDLFGLIVDEWESNAWKRIELLKTDDTNKQVQTSEDSVTIGNLLQEEEKALAELAEDDVGFFDILEEFHATTSALTETLGRIHKYTVSIGEKFSFHTEKTNEITAKQIAPPKPGSREAREYISKYKTIVDEAAEDLKQYAKDMEPELTDFKKEMGVILNTFRDAHKFKVGLDVPREQREENIAGLKALIDAMETITPQVSMFQQSIGKLPAMTGRFKKARSIASAILGQLVAELTISVDRGREILKDLENNEKE